MLPVLVLFLVTLFFFSDIIRSGGLFVERDLGPYFIPPRLFWVETLKTGEFPLWNPLNFTGYPLYATLQPAVLYPPNLVFFVLPFNIAFNGIIILHFFLAGTFTYVFLRFLETERGAAFLGATAFMLGGYLLSLHNLLSALLSVVWMPVVLLLFTKALRCSSKGDAVWAGVTLATSFFAGGVEIVLGICICLALMAVFPLTFCRTRAFALKALIITIAVFLSLSAIQLLPFLELAMHSIRMNGLRYEHAVTWSVSPVDLLSFVIPDPFGSLADRMKYWTRQSWLRNFYLGTLPLLLSIIFVVKEKRMKLFWVALVVFSVFLALGDYNPLYPYLYKFVPGMNKIRYPVKFLFLAIFALCVMSGLGLQYVVVDARQRKGQGIKWASIILATMAALALLLLNINTNSVVTAMKSWGVDEPIYNVATINLYNFKRNLFFFALSSAILWLIIESKGSQYAVASLCLVLTIDLFGNFGNYTGIKPDLYWADNWTVRQVRPNLDEYRVFATPLTSAPNTTVIAPNSIPNTAYQRILSQAVNLNYGIRSMGGAEVMRIKRTDDLHKALDASSSPDATRILDFSSVKYVISSKPISSSSFEFVGADIEGLKGNRKELLEEPTIKLYRNKRVLARTHLFTDYKIEPDPVAALAYLVRYDFEAEKILLLDEEPIWDERTPSMAFLEDPVGAKIVNERNNEIEIQAVAKRPSMLYLSDTYYPGWNAYIDGWKTKVYRANYNYRAVPLPSGAHSVIFRYEPLSFYIGASISAMTLLLLMIFGMKYILHKRNERQNIEHADVTASEF